MTDLKKQIEEAERLFAEAGFTVSIGGCGCCGSPWVRISHNGKDVVFDEREDPYGRYAEEASFCMHGDDT